MQARINICTEYTHIHWIYTNIYWYFIFIYEGLRRLQLTIALTVFDNICLYLYNSIDCSYKGGDGGGAGGMADVLASIRSGQVSLRKPRVEERKSPKR